MRERETPLNALIAKLTQKEDIMEAIKSAKELAERADAKSTAALAEVLMSTSLEEELKKTTDRLTELGDNGGIYKLVEQYGPTILELKKYTALALLAIGTPEALKILEEAKNRQWPGKFTDYAIELAEEIHNT